MSDKTLTRMDLSEAVFREVGLSRNDSAQLVENVLEYMSDALVNGEQVKISSFGTFVVREKGARMGRNPKTGEEVPIEPRRVLVAGGGPAGLKAASVAAERGHQVTLWERGPRLGGQALLAQGLPHREEAVRQWKRVCAEAGEVVARWTELAAWCRSGALEVTIPVGTKG